MDSINGQTDHLNADPTDGGPVGLNSLAVAIGEEAGTLEEVNEPYLIMKGDIRRTPQGRGRYSQRIQKARAQTTSATGGAQAELL